MAYDYELWTVYTNSDGTGIRCNSYAQHQPLLESQTMVSSGTTGSDMWGYRSAIYFQAGSGGRIEVFFIFDSSDNVNIYNNGSSFSRNPYDNNNNLYGLQFGSSGLWNWNYIKTGVNVPIFTNRQEWLDYISTPPTPQYNWQSVPSISGKNGISQPLSSHLDINDGEPITTSDTTKYSLNNNSNINKLVQDKLNS